jgi:SAM-dependent methyltransferase
MDLRQPLDELGAFDFIWIRFVLEYYLEGSVDIIRNAASALKPDGRLCLLDLDYNCLTHYPMKVEMESILQKLVFKMMQKFNFDPFVGRKMYTYLYDLGFVISRCIFSRTTSFTENCSKAMISTGSRRWRWLQ